MEESYPYRWKTQGEMEKLLVMSNFAFSHSVFKRLVSQGSQKVSLCGNGLMRMTQEAFIDSVDQCQTAQNMQSDL